MSEHHTTGDAGHHDSPRDTDRGAGAKKAGAFDIRVFIAALIGLYGVIILLVGIVSTSQDDLDRAGGLNLNVLAGIGMILGSAAFLLWARLRPVVVKPTPGGHDGGDERVSE